MMERKDWGITLIRIIVGVVFLAHGSQKVFGYGFSAVGGMFGHMGIPMAGFFGVVVPLVEFLGGLGLVVGLLTRWAAAFLVINMAVAVLKVHLGGGFFLPRGFEYALTLLVVNIALLIAGSGAFAIDNKFGKRV